MSIHASKAGFTLIEVVLGLMCLPIILTLVVSIFQAMINIKVPEVNQIHVLKYQLKQSLLKSTNVKFEDQMITYDYNNQSFIVELDGTRLVRRPGYEILLENVRYFKAEANYLQICNYEDCVEV